ncbi:MAG: hypothetical protein ACFFCS_08400 [Candidatus Hodarchaeota archaeon]
MKGIRGVFSSGDVEKYLQGIMELESKVKELKINMARYKVQANSNQKELNFLQRQVLKHETTIQEQRKKIVDLELQLEDLTNANKLLAQERDGALDNVKKKLTQLPEKEEFERYKAEHDSVTKEMKTLKKDFERSENQVHKLVEENLKLKDKLKFLKQSRI